MFLGGLPLAALVAPQQSFVLDLLSAVSAAAFGLRRLRRGYTGPAINVRRSSDNAAMDVGFTPAGGLDTATLLAFVGSNSGYVTTWYDQSGNGRHVTHTTATGQALILNSGVIVTTTTGRLSIQGQEIYSSASFPVTSNGEGSLNVVVQPTNNGSLTLGGVPGASASGNFFLYNNQTYFNLMRTSRASPVTYSTSPPSSLFCSTETIGPGASSAPLNIYINGALSLSSTINLGVSSSAVVQILASTNANSDYTNKVAEFIFFQPSLSTTDRQTLERNQGSYFGISVQ